MSWSEPEFAAIAMLITQEFGVAFPPARRTFAENAIRRASGFAHEHSLERYRERLTAEPPLLRALIAEVTVGETYFFRDPAQFDAIRTIVLPDLLQRRSSHAALRIWSAGCATGEEAYSLAILTADGGLAGCTLLLGTDVSNTAIDVARRGQYGAWSFRHDAAGWRERGFTHTGKHWTVAAAQRRVEFAVHNLMHPAPELGGIAGGASPEQARALRAGGEALGLAFQIQDDILDATSTEAAMGKRVGKDQGKGKITYPLLLGLEGARKELQAATERALCQLQSLPNPHSLNALATFLAERSA